MSNKTFLIISTIGIAFLGIVKEWGLFIPALVVYIWFLGLFLFIKFFEGAK
jgi:hypothetical protein